MIPMQEFGGAYGMMQFMPNTGPSFGVYPDSPPAVQIDAGMQYIDQLYNNGSILNQESND